MIFSIIVPKNIYLFLGFWVLFMKISMVSYIKGGMQAKGIGKQDREENI